MEQTVAERPLSREQHIDDGQTCDNGSLGADTHLGQGPSESWHPRRWTGWSSFRGDNLIQDKPVCRDFLRGRCARGTSCKFRHCESDSQDGYKNYVCYDFIRGRCDRVSCKFLHPESDKSTGCGPPREENLDAVANFGKSPFYGDKMDNDTRIRYFSREPRSSPCRRFVNGMCYRGESCPYLHSDYPTHDRPRNHCSTHLQQVVPTTSRNPGLGEGNIGNTLWTSQEHEEGDEDNDRSIRFTSRERRSKSPCRSFLRGMCYRGAACLYYHPDIHLRPRNDGTPPWRRGLEATPENPGFVEEHKEANEGNDRSTRCFSAGYRSRSPCRNFLRGRCYRGACCPYLHLDTHVRPRGDCSTHQIQGVEATSQNHHLCEGSVIITSRTSEQHEEANEGLDQSNPSFSAGYRSKPPCRNFLRGRCYRGACCPYLHLDTCVNTQQLQEVAAASENPGFGEGSENITLKTSQKHEEVNEDEDLRSRYFPKGSRSRSPCRNFLSGKCYRGASCPYLHLATYERSRYPADDGDSMVITSRSWSSERQRKRPLEDLGDKPRPEVCLKYCRGRCTLGESCRYLHSFHEYAKSASDWTKQPHLESAGALRNSSGSRQCEPSMMRQDVDGSFDEKTKRLYVGNTEKPNVPNGKDEAAVVDQQTCETSGQVIGRNCENSEADDNINLQCQPFKRWRSRSGSPTRDELDGRKMGRDESQDNFHRRRSTSRSPVTPRDDFDWRKIRSNESQDNFTRGRGYSVARFQYPYSRSYRYNGPRYFMNKEPYYRVAATSVGPSSHKVNEDPNVMDTQGRDEVAGHEMQQDQWPNGSLESVKNAVQCSHVDHDGGRLVRDCSGLGILKGENAVGLLIAESDSTTCRGNHSSPVSTSKGGDNAEVNADWTQDGTEKTDEQKQAVKTYIRKLESNSSESHLEPSKIEVTDSSTHQLPSSSTREASLHQSDIASVSRISDDIDTQDVVMICRSVEEPEEGTGVIKEIQNTVELAQGTTEDGTSVSGHSERNSMRMSQSSSKAAISSSRRKLLVLDVNGLLADIVNVGDVPRGYKPDVMVAMKAVFKRPFCDDFMEFCFERFNVGIWSSRTKKNVDRVVDFLMSNTKKRLLFCWDQAQCTETGYKTIENRDKPLVLKELKKLWEKQEIDLPWDKGFYNETNTVLLDDSPYKALRNPPYTAIFPYAYKFRDVKDRSLGPGGDLRVYLERLAAADDVQKFIQENPFGQRPITKSNLSWGFYSKIVGAHLDQQEGNSSCTPATKVFEDSAIRQEQTANNSPASKNGWALADQQKVKGNNTPAMKSAGDHAQQREGSADKSPGAQVIGAHSDKCPDAQVTGAHSDQQKGRANNGPANEGAGDHAEEREQSTDKTGDPKVVGAHSDQQEGNADDNPFTESAGVHANQQEGTADKTPATKDFGACVNQQDGDADNTSATQSVASHVNRQEGNNNTTVAKVMANSNQLEGNANDTSATTNGEAHVNLPEENVNNSLKPKIIAADTDQQELGNADNTPASKDEDNGGQQEGNGDKTPAAS